MATHIWANDSKLCTEMSGIMRSCNDMHIDVKGKLLRMTDLLILLEK
jgi:hypothetical protein